MKSLLPERPFSYLVAHFVRRLFASDQEQGEGGIGAGLGTVLALLAAPGAFASLVLLDKYSSLLQYFRGQANFNPFRTSISDEYFFVVLSMTIIGLVMVMRWNRLLPDRRDFANLAVLPIPIHHVFLANLCALFGLALLFAIDVNAVSALLFPLFVSMQDGRTAVFLQMVASHVATVFLASLFSFFSIFAIVGLLMLLLPRSWFKPVSVSMRIILVVGLLTEFFSNLLLQLSTGKIPKHSGHYLRFLPSFWFLGIYEQIAGLASADMKQMGNFAMAMLVTAIAASLICYTLCYQRHFRRLAESSSETMGGSRYRGWRLPQSIKGFLFRSPFEEACTGFIWKVLSRSERHVMFLGGYVGVGLVIVADSTLGRAATSGNLPSSDILSVPLLTAFFLITGLRFVFEMPASVEANWIFQIAALSPVPPPPSVISRLILALTIPPQLVLCAILIAPRYGWLAFLLTAAFNSAVTVLLTVSLTQNFRRIPFTFEKQHDMRALVARMLICLLAITVVVPVAAALERSALAVPWRFLWFVPLLSICAYFIGRQRPEDVRDLELVFEDRIQGELQLLKLS